MIAICVATELHVLLDTCRLASCSAVVRGSVDHAPKVVHISRQVVPTPSCASGGCPKVRFENRLVKAWGEEWMLPHPEALNPIHLLGAMLLDEDEGRGEAVDDRDSALPSCRCACDSLPDRAPSGVGAPLGARPFGMEPRRGPMGTTAHRCVFPCRRPCGAPTAQRGTSGVGRQQARHSNRPLFALSHMRRTEGA